MTLFKKSLILFAFFFCAMEALGARTRIVFVRHGETVYNATGRGSGENTLTAKGKKQAKSLIKKFSRVRFEKIYVSPKGRTKKTVLPYLRSEGLRLPDQISYSGTVQIWQEITECCWRSDNVSRAMKRLKRAVRLIRSRHSRSGDTLLIVGHSMSGRRLIKLLTGGPSVHLKNGKPVVLEERSNGKFKILATDGEIP